MPVLAKLESRFPGPGAATMMLDPNHGSIAHQTALKKTDLIRTDSLEKPVRPNHIRAVFVKNGS
jgi:hypothetical protein